MRIDELRFLVVEDQGFQRWAIENILAVLGAKHVQVVEDGAAAIDMLRRPDTPVDIVITDLDMPRMDGMELIRRLALARSQASMVVISGLARPVLDTVRTMGDAYGASIVAVLEKPATTRGLEAAIEKHRARAAPASMPDRVAAVEVLCALRGNEMQARFRPRVELASGAVVAAEADIVWIDPGRGIVCAPEFMDVVMRAGVHGEVAWTLLRASFAAFARWREVHGRRIGLCVPLAAECLGNPDFAQRASDCARATAVPAAAVLVQLDRPPAGDGAGTMLENISRLRMKGFAVAAPLGPRYRLREDFARIPCSELSIDAAHLRESALDPESEAALRASLRAARDAGMDIAARGVASREDWQRARTLGARHASGPCLGAPLTAEAFGAEVARRPTWKGFR